MTEEVTVKEALAGIGLFDRPGEAAVLFTTKPFMKNFLARDVLDDDVETFHALYHASGLFRPSAFVGRDGKQARDKAALVRVVFLPFDFDLIDWLGFPPGSDDSKKARRKAAQELIWAAPQSELDDELKELRATIERTFADLSLPIHRLDYTGYGYCAYIYLGETDQLRVDSAQAAHKHIIQQINKQSSNQIVDRQASDAGTRVTRVPGSLNRKGENARKVTTLVPYTGETWPLSIEAPERLRPVSIDIPSDGAGLSAEDTASLIEAINPHWSHGQKHDVALGFAGMLAKARIPEDQALAIVASLAASDEKPWDRANCVRTSYAKARAGQSTTGYHKLKDALPSSALSFIDGILSRYRTASNPTASVNRDGEAPIIEIGADLADEAGVSRAIGDEALLNRREREVITLVADPPKSSFYGVVSQYLDIVKDTTEAADALHLGAVLTVMSAMIGRRVGARFGSDNIYPMLYSVLVGATGWSRKETAMKRAMNDLVAPLPGALEILLPGFYEINDITSAEGLAEVMAKNPNTMIRLAELTVLLSNMKRKGTENLPDKLINLWDAPKVFEIIRRSNSTRVEYPALTLLGATQPGRLASAMTEEHILSGFANRIVFVAGAPKPAMAEPKSVDRKAMYDLYRGIHRGITTYHTGQLLPRSSATKKRWDEWYMAIREKTGDDEETEAMRARHQMIALKVALIFAVTEGSTEIELKHLDPAIAFVEWMWRNLIVLMRSWGVSNWTQISNRVEDVLRKYGPMKRHPLSRYCANRKWNIRDFSIVLDALIKTESIVADATGVLSWTEPGTSGDKKGGLGTDGDRMGTSA